MPELFEAIPSRSMPLEGALDAEVADIAHSLLGDERFRSFRLFGEGVGAISPQAILLVRKLGQVAQSSTEPESFTVTVDDEKLTAIGFDIIQGTPPAVFSQAEDKPRGTSYERPIGKGARGKADLVNKSFAFAPLEGEAEITPHTATKQTVKPGSVFLAPQGEKHTVFIPTEHVMLEFILTHDEEAQHNDWTGYSANQQVNPNLGR